MQLGITPEIQACTTDSGGTTDTTAGIELGNAISLNSCRNNHAFAAGSFASPGNANFDRMKGSSQLSRFYLRGRTLNTNTSELTSDWHKDANTVPTINNTISLQYTEEDDTQVQTIIIKLCMEIHRL